MGRISTTRIVLACLAASTLAARAQQPAAAPDPLIKENATVKVSNHVYVIPDGSVPLVPNVGIVVGSRATLVVDSGLGPRNGETVVREVAKVRRNAELYVVSTHMHPEHALGEPAFPATAKIIRARAEQQDVDEFGLATAEIFSRRSPLTADLLRGVQYRKADIFFEKEYALDLGGVRVQMLALGPAHTRGDVVVFVEGDGILFTGDIVMSHTFLAFVSPSSSVKAWLSALDRIGPLRPNRIVPSHGVMGDSSLIDLDRAYLTTLQARAGELKKQGTPVDQAVGIITKELQAKYPDWTNAARLEAPAKIAYTEQP